MVNGGKGVNEGSGRTVTAQTCQVLGHPERAVQERVDVDPRCQFVIYKFGELCTVAMATRIERCSSSRAMTATANTYTSKQGTMKSVGLEPLPFVD